MRGRKLDRWCPQRLYRRLRQWRWQRQLGNVGCELPVSKAFAPHINRRRGMGFIVRCGMRFQERDQALALNRAMPLPLNEHEPAHVLFKRHEERPWITTMEPCHPKWGLERATSKFS